MLTSRSRMKLSIPNEPGQWVVIRRLSGCQLEEAEEARTAKVRQQLVALGKDAIDALSAFATPDGRAQVEAAAKDPANDYDWETVLRYGIVEWSYSDPVTAEDIADLDKATRDGAVHAILRHSGILGLDEGKGCWQTFTDGSMEYLVRDAQQVTSLESSARSSGVYRPLLRES